MVGRGAIITNHVGRYASAAPIFPYLLRAVCRDLCRSGINLPGLLKHIRLVCIEVRHVDRFTNSGQCTQAYKKVGSDVRAAKVADMETSIGCWRWSNDQLLGHWFISLSSRLSPATRSIAAARSRFRHLKTGDAGRLLRRKRRPISKSSCPPR